MNYELYRPAILKKVCEHCVDSDEHGNCALTSGRQCGVEMYLEAIVDVVHSTKSDRMEDYIRVLRERVCSHCKNQDSTGDCQFRMNADCGLDRFFELVVEAIEETDALSK